MARTRRNPRRNARESTIVDVSSSSSSSSSTSSSQEESESEEEIDRDHHAYETEYSSGEELDSDEEEEDEDSLCDRVTRLLEEKGSLENSILKVKECKAYLRKHGLRLAGTKVVCIRRILDHWRLKDGNGEAIYPRSSFVINCTGDVCKGDVVLFTQQVYERFDRVMRHGKILGKRTIAGKIVKESYGSAKQQHTFTVEVLWSKGVKKLPPLFPLLVKGRNLYKLKTFRQPWDNELERRKVLAEKHKRGSAARLVRARNKSKKYSNKGPSPKRKTAELEGRKSVVHRRGKINGKRALTAEISESSRGHKKYRFFNGDSHPSFGSCYIQDHHPPPSYSSHHGTITHFSSNGIGTTSNMVSLPPIRHYFDPFRRPAAHSDLIEHTNYTRYYGSNPDYFFGTRNSTYFPGLINVDNRMPPFPSREHCWRSNRDLDYIRR